MIRTRQDWWNAVEEHWDNLLNIIGDQIDLYSLATEQPGKYDSELTGRTILQELAILKNNKNPKLVRYFAGAWCIASEAYAWSKPSWGTLCELCSEEYLLYDEDIEYSGEEVGSYEK